jgi:3-dehydroquinate dehydratase type I
MYCLSIGNGKLKTILELIQHYELAELRLDLNKFSKSDIKILCEKHKGLIFTFRPGNEFTDKIRLEALSFAIRSGAAYIDVDINNKKTFINTLKEKIAESESTKLICSFHDYQYTPTNNVLFDHILKMGQAEADLMKVVCTSHGSRDNDRILSFNSSFKNMIAFNMGEDGKPTRALCLREGAPFTYVTTGLSSTAPGQMTKEEVEKFLATHS